MMELKPGIKGTDEVIVTEANTAKAMGSVGTKICAKHVSATPVVMKVTCVSELVEVDGRRLVFKITASDACGVLSSGKNPREPLNTRLLSKSKFPSFKIFIISL